MAIAFTPSAFRVS